MRHLRRLRGPRKRAAGPRKGVRSVGGLRPHHGRAGLDDGLLRHTHTPHARRPPGRSERARHVGPQLHPGALLAPPGVVDVEVLILAALLGSSEPHGAQPKWLQPLEWHLLL